MDQRSLVGYSPWGCKESDMTERLSKAHTAPPGTGCSVLPSDTRLQTLPLCSLHQAASFPKLASNVTAHQSPNPLCFLPLVFSITILFSPSPLPHPRLPRGLFQAWAWRLIWMKRCSSTNTRVRGNLDTEFRRHHSQDQASVGSALMSAILSSCPSHLPSLTLFPVTWL